MKAIILSAGQGKRLLPLTEFVPKCLLPVCDDVCSLELQLRALARCGVERATVVVGFGSEVVERFLRTTPIPGLAVDILLNPFYAHSDNLATCWLARHCMEDDFLLLNGDTIFEDRVVRRVLDGPSSSIAVTIDRKPAYDDDDMKVSIDDDGRLLAIGKTLKPEMVNGESIGLLCFRGSGTKCFREALDRAIRVPGALKAWYLSVVNELAQEVSVDTVSVRGFWWREIDSAEDLNEARRSHPEASGVGAPQIAAAGARS
ncbi:MAG: phosphocholine cytidylyltransferase family protein [Myxococcota bacterium]|jgi:choline kinase|nr:nucleotidyltransferase [Deltaproteobacteria bacterium]MCP4241688.1 phosphocholine cytidylyltransferase family protein [bacterium]MDP6075185.1 phosphocholine cytidylyltransferase family protein [Myxococcota bacterium]MDP6243836.1 phosphocholine cytidylyltransferase family protein [Myxococcota bacterium]MDP7075896.1 phosphocholine cytidylyltransferase family protein [Myxococcota bacterium]